MHAVWVHDHIFRTNRNGSVFSAGKLPASVWQRYRPVADKLTVIARSRPLAAGESAKGLVNANAEGVSFRFVPNLGTPKAQLLKRGQAKAIIRKVLEDADCLIARIPSFTASEAIPLARALGKPLALEIVGCGWDTLWNIGNIKGRLYAPITYLQMRQQARQAPYAIYVTREFLQQRYPCPGYTEHASNVEIASPHPAVLDQRLNKPVGDKLIFGQIGYLDNQYKGIQIAMQALALSKESIGNFEFRILGGGNPEPWLALARKLGIVVQVKLEGTLSGSDAVNTWLDDLDVFLQPSLTEGLPRALVEAMARACPALASQVGGIPELIETSCLHHATDAKQLSNNICQKACDPNWRKQQSIRNFKHARHYASDVLNSRREAFWKQFAEHVAQTK